MGRSRKPTEMHALSGAFKKNPARARARGNEPRPTSPLGSPPEQLSAEEKAVWLELADIAPAKVLTGADRWLVEVCCRIMARLREDGIGGRDGVSVGELSQLMAGLRTMGLTPADRSKISVPQDAEEANPFSELASEAQGDYKPN